MLDKTYDQSCMQGLQTKNDARPPLAVLNYIVDKACLSYQGEHCSPIDLCQLLM